MEEYQRRLAAMSVPTFEQYQAQTGKSWKEYVAAYSAAAAGKQVQAGEIPADYGSSHSFTPGGVWVESGSAAAIGGLPAEVREIFPGVEKAYQTAYETATESSVITSSRAGEPQTSFPPQSLPLNTQTTTAPVFSSPGGAAPIQFNDPGVLSGVSQGYTSISVPTNFQQVSNGGGGGDGGGLGLLALIAAFLFGMGG